MNTLAVRSAAPIVYGVVLAVLAVLASGAVVPFAVVGALLLGLMYAVTSGRTGGRGRDRSRRRR